MVDDGSTDATRERALAYAPEVTTITQDNQGLSGARNSGIRAASAQWIALLDADDEWLPHHLEEFHETAKLAPQVSWYGAPVNQFIDETLEEVWTYKPHPKCPLRNGMIPDYLQAVYPLACFSAPTMIISKDVFAKVGLFDPSLRTGQDLEMWFRIGLQFPEVGYSHRVGAKVYWRRGSNTDLRKWAPERRFEVIESAWTKARDCGHAHEARAIHRLRAWVYSLCKEAIRRKDSATIRRAIKAFHPLIRRREQALFTVPSRSRIACAAISKAHEVFRRRSREAKNARGRR